MGLIVGARDGGADSVDIAAVLVAVVDQAVGVHEPIINVLCDLNN